MDAAFLGIVTPGDAATSALFSRRASARDGHPPHRLDLQPEQRLMIAVMNDAIRCIQKYRYARDSLGRKRFDEESRWILSNDNSWIHAFIRICEVLDLDPHAVRHSLSITDERNAGRPRRAAACRPIDLAERRLSC